MRRLALVLVGSLAAAGVLAAAPAPAPAQQAATVRSAPAATAPADVAVALSQADRAAGSARWAVVARDDVFADALTGAVVAGGGGPLLLTGRDRLPEATRAELERVLPAGATVHVMGGTAAVSEAVVAALSTRWRVERVAGPNRVETALAAAALVDGRDRGGAPPAEVLVAAGFRWPDAVTGGAAAARRGSGLVLVDEGSAPDAGSNVAVRRYLAAARPTQLWVLGGEAAVPAGHAAAVSAHAERAGRLSGGDRAATAAAVAGTLWPDRAGATVVRGYAGAGEDERTTTAWGYALVASPRAAATDRPPLLVHGRPVRGTWDGIPLGTADRLAADGCRGTADVVGAEAAVDAAALAEVTRLRCAPSPQVTVTEVVGGLNVPWAVAPLPDGRLLVTERPGRLRVVADGRLQAEPLWTAPQVYASGEAGLMGMVVEPGGRSALVCVSQHPGPRVRVLRLAIEGATATTAGVVADLGPAAPTHDGCALALTAEGHVLATMGDGQAPAVAQDPRDPRGKVHRFTPDGQPVPGNANGTVWTVGHRNPQGIDQHPVSGVVLAAEHGPADHDEINVLRDGGDYGWPTYSGPSGGAGGTIDPIWSSGATTIATAGTAVAREAAWGGLRGALLVATLKDARLHALPLSPDGTRAAGAVQVLVDRTHGRLRAVVPAPGGGVWVTTSTCGAADCRNDRVLLVRPR